MPEVTKKAITDWKLWKERLNTAKEKESNLRNLICAKILGNKEKETVNDNLFGIPLKAVAKATRKINKDELKKIWGKLSKEEKACIKFNPEVVESEYKKLSKDSILHKVIETKPGMPSLNIKE